ncbi:MAG: DNA-deoxyinosine glycosylase [Lachnospiraceae bacterium]|nr:DNA-deoxyinosine glycosylase [Lachnospiraceae bacterium]MCH4028995.1 DNA-deoxyinosine glycosylase [Lachnospiraceae bacterium]MCH4066850.1 DNA-deoxyinosine glycosylase [Lachnospiraceae bacterium]MCH4112876.1 DNA-deoxyinosine glycosylase [Lachnospiraceae bacterium]MCI1353443.1 DNA-deoxyinosine glycosylase [Lachnospiraceae bacterium]
MAGTRTKMEDGTGAGGKKYQHLSHEFGPLYDGASRTLLLGSFPSVKSRDAQFYYGHPQNRFWKVLAALYGEAVPASKEEKIRFVLGHHLALWDVIESCDICGSSDASIRNAVPTDLPPILAKTEINRIFINGKTAFRLYEKYQKDRTGMEAVCLPSTSPANAAWSLAGLVDAWKIIRYGE